MSNKILNFETKEDRHCPKKSWGHEEWIVNNDMYCGKRLHFDLKGGCTSLHFHMKKHETMYVESGQFVIEFRDTKSGLEHTLLLCEGQSIAITPGLPHRIVAHQDKSILVEFSTHHEDSDSYRILK